MLLPNYFINGTIKIIKLNPLTKYRHIAIFVYIYIRHPSTGSGPESPIELTHIGVYFKECASQKTHKYSVSRQYWQLMYMYSQENLGTLISGLICDS